MTTKRAKPWDRPSQSNIPNRNGDNTALPLYTALGRALSAWEGVEAALANLLGAFLSTEPEVAANQCLLSYGETIRIKEKVAKIREAGRLFLDLQQESKLKSEIDTKLESILEQYRGWSQRRNEIAHGCVAPMRAPDYSDINQPIRKFHSLLPSHSRVRYWPNVEPEFNYVAAEVRAFGAEFAALDNRI